MTPRAMPAVALLLGGLPMPDRSKAISQTKKYLGRKSDDLSPKTFNMVPEVKEEADHPL